MKPFHFPLESLRVLRKQKESSAQQHYAKMLTARDRAETQWHEAVAELSAGWDSLIRDLAHGVAAGKIMDVRTWCLVLEIRRNERKAALDEARRVTETAFQGMLAAVREREALDRFHDKSRRAHDRAVQREEQNMFDEIAVQSGGAHSLLQLAGYEN